MIFIDASVLFPSGLALQNTNDASVQRLEDVGRARENVMDLSIEILGETFTEAAR
jgi:hypothetical protein